MLRVLAECPLVCVEQTQQANPHFLPEMQAHCAVVNFTVTPLGLEQQLLACVVGMEVPSLEQELAAVQATLSQFRVQMLELEEQLLERLYSAPADILSDVSLIDGLEATKHTAQSLADAVMAARTTERRIVDAREVYRPVAWDGAAMFFVATQLSVVSHMYRFSLRSFMACFQKVRCKDRVFQDLITSFGDDERRYCALTVTSVIGGLVLLLGMGRFAKCGRCRRVLWPASEAGYP